MSLKNKINIFFSKLFILCGSILVFLLIGELALKLSGYNQTYYYPRNLFIPDAKAGYRLNPLFKSKNDLGEFNYDIYINLDGFRDVGADFKQEGKIHILGLGDSFTFGTGVNLQDTYLKQLEKLIDSKNNLKCGVINAGVPGYGTRQELELYKKIFPIYKPNIVLIGFTVYNDPYDNVHDYTVQNGFLVENAPAGKNTAPPAFYALKSFLRRHSRIYSIITNRLKNDPKIRNLLFRCNIGINVFPLELQFYNKNLIPETENSYSATEKILNEFSQICRKNNIKLVVVGIPSPVQVYPELWSKVSIANGFDEKCYDLDLPNKRLGKICSDNQITFLDLLPLFRTYAKKGKQLYYKIDGHWNACGHEYAAGLIYSFLKENGYLGF